MGDNKHGSSMSASESFLVELGGFFGAARRYFLICRFDKQNLMLAYDRCEILHGMLMPYCSPSKKDEMEAKYGEIKQRMNGFSSGGKLYQQQNFQIAHEKLIEFFEELEALAVELKFFPKRTDEN